MPPTPETAPPPLPAEGPNAAQIDYWNGRAGSAWTDLQDSMDEKLRPVTDALLEAAAFQEGERVLDIGCGCGDTSLRAAERVGASGSVTGLDISTPMLARATARGAGRANVSWRLDDAARARFEAPFDVAISRFGVMFFTDPTAAFHNVAASLRPGGRLVFACWQDLKRSDWMTLPSRAAAPFLPPPEPTDPHAPGPGAFADRDRVFGILSTAGFVDIDIAPRESRILVGGDIDEAVAHVRRIGPLARSLAEVSPDVAALALAAVREAFERVAATGTFALGAHYWVVHARRP